MDGRKSTVNGPLADPLAGPPISTLQYHKILRQFGAENAKIALVRRASHPATEIMV